MTTARDYEFGERPHCAACGGELDIETDCRHDGYGGSSHAHGGRGSYGMGSHHFLFADYCDFCQKMPTPMRFILKYNGSWEWLECGHKLSTPHDRFGKIRPGNRRRCCKCKKHAPVEFNVKELLRLQKKEAFTKILKNNRNCAAKTPRHDTRKNWDRYIQKMGLTLENCQLFELGWYSCEKKNRGAKLREALASKATYDLRQKQLDWAYNSDDH